MSRVLVRKRPQGWSIGCDWCFGDKYLGSSRWTHALAVEIALSHVRARHAWKVQNVCPRCGDGLPVCSDKKSSGAKYTHAEVCETYEWSEDECERCQRLDQARGA